jgi:cell division protein FtsW
MAKKLAFDKVLFTAVCFLVAFGLAMVYSASGALARDHGAGANPFLIKQALAAALGFAAMWVAMHADYRLLRKPAVVYALVIGALTLLVAVLFAPKLNNTRRWFFVGGISVQPSELAKLALIPFLAYQL